MHFFSVIAVTAALAAVANAFPTGAGTCLSNATVIAAGGGGAMGKPSELGFSLEVGLTGTYTPGDNTPISVKVGGTKQFKGILIYALDKDKNHVGSWIPSTGIQFKACQGDPKGTLTHTSPAMKGPTFGLLWVPPTQSTGDIFFTGTVVTGKATGFQVLKSGVFTASGGGSSSSSSGDSGSSSSSGDSGSSSSSSGDSGSSSSSGDSGSSSGDSGSGDSGSSSGDSGSSSSDSGSGDSGSSSSSSGDSGSYSGDSGSSSSSGDSGSYSGDSGSSSSSGDSGSSSSSGDSGSSSGDSGSSSSSSDSSSSGPSPTDSADSSSSDNSGDTGKAAYQTATVDASLASAIATATAGAVIPNLADNAADPSVVMTSGASPVRQSSALLAGAAFLGAFLLL